MNNIDDFSVTKNEKNAIALHKHCDLLLQSPIQEGRPAFLSAASGLVCCNNHFYVVADDELHLGIFPNEPTVPGITQLLVEGELPLEHKPRKKQKPDFEVLAYLPPTAKTKTPMLIVMGSGSRANRALGLLLPLDDKNEIPLNAAPLPFELGVLYRELEREFGIVNIEGATLRGDQLLLLQRGNKKAGINAIVSLNLHACIDAMLRQNVDASVLQSIEIVELGSHGGVGLGFTDAMCLPDNRLLALAVAEDTDDPYLDGEASASYLCRFDAQNQLQATMPVIASAKTEGLALWQPSRKDRTLAFVTDADDASIPAMLLTAPLSAFI